MISLCKNLTQFSRQFSLQHSDALLMAQFSASLMASLRLASRKFHRVGARRPPGWDSSSPLRRTRHERHGSVSATARVLVSGQKAESCARDEQPYHVGGCHGGDGRLHEGGVENPVTAMTVTTGFIRGGLGTPSPPWR